MKAVEEALLDDFGLWLKENEKADEGSLENRLDEFMEEKYATTAEKILETIKAMNSPPPSREEETSNPASAVLQNLAACEAAGDDSDEGTRKKRSTAGKGRYQRKKRDYVGKIPKRRTPPPPQFGKPLLSKKKSWVYFSF